MNLYIELNIHTHIYIQPSKITHINYSFSCTNGPRDSLCVCFCFPRTNLFIFDSFLAFKYNWINQCHLIYFLSQIWNHSFLQSALVFKDHNLGTGCANYCAVITLRNY